MAVNQVGSVLFFLAGLAAFTRPATSTAIDLGLVNWGTFLGAVCFVIGGVHAARSSAQPPRSSPTAQHHPLRAIAERDGD